MNELYSDTHGLNSASQVIPKGAHLTTETIEQKIDDLCTSEEYNAEFRIDKKMPEFKHNNVSVLAKLQINVYQRILALRNPRLDLLMRYFFSNGHVSRVELTSPSSM